MKKSLLFTLAASVMLCASVFTGCSDLPEEYYPSAETKAAAEAARMNTAVPDGATAIVDFSKMDKLNKKIAGGSIELVNDTTFTGGKKALLVKSQSYGGVCIKIKETDLSGKTLVIRAKGVTPATSTGDNDHIAAFIASGEPDDMAAGETKWEARSDSDFQMTDASKYQEYSFKVPDDFCTRYWKADEKADAEEIKYVGIRLKNAKFDSFQIAAIYVK